jgi:glycosyltransferase involved in cell wall biosynthesis
MVVSPPSAWPGWKAQIKSILKGRGWISQHKPSYFDYIDVPHHVLDRNRPICDADLPDADVVIATWWETAEWVAKLSPSKGAKAYFIQNYEAFDYLPKERVKATWSLPFHKITIAQWLVDLAQNHYGDSYVSLVPNAVDTEQFWALPREKQPNPTVGIMYSHLEWKGCDISFRAFEMAAEAIPNLRLLAFGLDHPTPKLPLPQKSEFIYCPPQDQLRHIYAKCDGWLFGSYLEGFGLPILEAMACRTPVIGTPVGAAPELLANGRGFLSPVGDAEAMAESIIQLSSMSEHAWKQMSNLAYERATSYTWDDATMLFEIALKTAIKRHQNGELRLEHSSQAMDAAHRERSPLDLQLSSRMSDCYQS